jgi:hypothetical protein
MAEIGKEEGLKGYWKGNLPQVLDITTIMQILICDSCPRLSALTPIIFVLLH